jgi:hypothetical protein
MLMIQMMRGYEDNLRERNGLNGIIWLPTGPSPSGRWGPSVGPLGQGMGYGMHDSVELSGEFEIERAGEDTERWMKYESGVEY